VWGVGLFMGFMYFALGGLLFLTTGDSGFPSVYAFYFGKAHTVVGVASQSFVTTENAASAIPAMTQAQGGYHFMDSVTGFFLAFAFLFSGAWIWLWLGIYLVFGSCFWYDDKIPNGIWLTIGATVLWFVLWPHAWGSFREHMFQLFVYAIPSYLALGTIWSFWKWSMTMREMKDQITRGH
jgi:hypothetical protein